MQSIIDGRRIAQEMIGVLSELSVPPKYLAVVLVGDNSASESFVVRKERIAASLGIDFRIQRFSKESTEKELVAAVHHLAADERCGSIIVQLPLPDHMDRNKVLSAIPGEKDVDVLGRDALGTFYSGTGLVLPPAARVVEKVAEACKRDLTHSRVAVVGPGFLVGKPVATWLTGKVPETLLFEKGSDFGLLREAEIVVSGTGVPGLLTVDLLKENALVIDFGYGEKEGKLLGDFNPYGAEEKGISYTPTPGGTGPTLVAALFENFYRLTAGT